MTSWKPPSAIINYGKSPFFMANSQEKPWFSQLFFSHRVTPQVWHWEGQVDLRLGIPKGLVPYRQGRRQRHVAGLGNVPKSLGIIFAGRPMDWLKKIETDLSRDFPMEEMGVSCICALKPIHLKNGNMLKTTWWRHWPYFGQLGNPADHEKMCLLQNGDVTDHLHGKKQQLYARISSYLIIWWSPNHHSSTLKTMIWGRPQMGDALQSSSILDGFFQYHPAIKGQKQL